MEIKNTLNRIASVLALLIGLMAVFAGGKVLEGMGVLEAGDETIPLSADMLVEMSPETHHRLVNRGAARCAC